jgi:hypothetical protein
VRALRVVPVLIVLLGPAIAGLPIDLLRSARAVPPHLAGRFRNPAGFQQSASGQYFVFDRRSQAVFGLDERMDSAWEIVKIGAEEGRIIVPTAFSVAPGGSFAVADAPGSIARIQFFSPAGARIGGFNLAGRPKMRLTFENVSITAISSLFYTGSSILISQPETESLFVEYALSGEVKRVVGHLRATGHEADPEVHYALNTGIPLVDPTGGFIFVFQAGVPAFRKYDADGNLLFERLMQGRELDAFIGRLPTTWPRRKTADGEMPVVSPTVRTAAVSSTGNLWVSFVEPYTYVYAPDGDKIRTVQFRGAGVVSPSSLSFGATGRLLVTPGLYEFAP